MGHGIPWEHLWGFGDMRGHTHAVGTHMWHFGAVEGDGAGHEEGDNGGTQDTGVDQDPLRTYVGSRGHLWGRGHGGDTRVAPRGGAAGRRRPRPRDAPDEEINEEIDQGHVEARGFRGPPWMPGSLPCSAARIVSRGGWALLWGHVSFRHGHLGPPVCPPPDAWVPPTLCRRIWAREVQQLLQPRVGQDLGHMDSIGTPPSPPHPQAL